MGQAALQPRPQAGSGVEVDLIPDLQDRHPDEVCPLRGGARLTRAGVVAIARGIFSNQSLARWQHAHEHGVTSVVVLASAGKRSPMSRKPAACSPGEIQDGRPAPEVASACLPAGNWAVQAALPPQLTGATRRLIADRRKRLPASEVSVLSRQLEVSSVIQPTMPQGARSVPVGTAVRRNPRRVRRPAGCRRRSVVLASGGSGVRWSGSRLKGRPAALVHRCHTGARRVVHVALKEKLPRLRYPQRTKGTRGAAALPRHRRTSSRQLWARGGITAGVTPGTPAHVPARTARALLRAALHRSPDTVPPSSP